MSKKTIIICGVSGGIGQEVAKKFLANGDQVCGIYHDKEKFESLRDGLGRNNLDLYQMDLVDDQSVGVGFKNLLEKHKEIDAVVFSVSCAIGYKPILDADWQDYSKHVDLQLKGLYLIIKNLKEQVKSGRGIKFVILLTEACIGKPPAGLSPYVSAKYSLMGMAKSMAVELAKYKCTVNMVSPGMVQTDLIKNFPPKMIELQGMSNPLGRIAEPADVANLIYFLVQEEAKYINGANITVNGGQVLL